MRFLKIKRDNELMIEPLDRIPLFNHCTGGRFRIEFDTFSIETIPILHAHGIDIITYEDGKNL